MRQSRCGSLDAELARLVLEPVHVLFCFHCCGEDSIEKALRVLPSLREGVVKDQLAFM